MLQDARRLCGKFRGRISKLRDYPLSVMPPSSRQEDNMHTTRSPTHPSLCQQGPCSCGGESESASERRLKMKYPDRVVVQFAR